MKVDGGRGKLYDAQQTIRQKWLDVEGKWSDAVRVGFEAEIWQPLDDFTSEELRAIDRLARILNECRHACEGQRE